MFTVRCPYCGKKVSVVAISVGYGTACRECKKERSSHI